MKIRVTSINYTDDSNDALAAANVEGRGIDVVIVDEGHYGFTADYEGPREALTDMLVDYFALEARKDVDRYVVL